MGAQNDQAAMADAATAKGFDLKENFGFMGWFSIRHLSHILFVMQSAYNINEEVARLHLEKIGVVLIKLTKAQAEYLNVPVDGPYKPEHYRY